MEIWQNKLRIVPNEGLRC